MHSIIEKLCQKQFNQSKQWQSQAIRATIQQTVHEPSPQQKKIKKKKIKWCTGSAQAVHRQGSVLAHCLASYMEHVLSLFLSLCKSVHVYFGD